MVTSISGSQISYKGGDIIFLYLMVLRKYGFIIDIT